MRAGRAIAAVGLLALAVIAALLALIVGLRGARVALFAGPTVLRLPLLGLTILGLAILAVPRLAILGLIIPGPIIASFRELAFGTLFGARPLSAAYGTPQLRNLCEQVVGGCCVTLPRAFGRRR